MKLSNGVPTYDEVMLPLLKVAATGPLTRAEATERVSNEMALTPEQRAVLMPRGHTVIRDRVGWARTYLVQAGLLRSVRRGVFELTERGRSLLATKPLRIDMALLQTFPEFQAFRARSRSLEDSETPSNAVIEDTSHFDADTPEDRIGSAIDEIELALRIALLDRIRSSKPEFFELLVIDLLTRMGYGGYRPDAGQHVGGSGDGGVDGLINLDVLGLDQVYIQAKRYKEDNVVAGDAIRSFAGALDMKGASRGVFITTSSFTKDARASANAIRTKQIVLIDGNRLADLLIAHDVGVREDRRVVVKRLDEDFFEE